MFYAAAVIDWWNIVELYYQRAIAKYKLLNSTSSFVA
jgi:uncharacterized protein YktA (UPF0223 family)